MSMSRLGISVLLLGLGACGGTVAEGASAEASSEAATATASQEVTDATSPRDTESAVDVPAARSAAGVYALNATTLSGAEADLEAYDGDVTLIVNVASECGYTPQYAGLQQLHERFAERGFAVLGFPSNEFGGQEPGTAAEIQAFCTGEFGVEFPMFEKVRTKSGEGQSPVYAKLEELSGELPTWNFCKYLVSRDGARVAFFPSKVAPESDELVAAIERELAETP